MARSRNRRLACLVGVLALGAMVQGAAAQSAFEIKVLSSRPDLVSGGDAVVQVRLPSTVPVQQVTVLRNGVDVTSVFAPAGGTTLYGLVSGLTDGVNTLAVATRTGGEVRATTEVTNWPSHGPIFAGPHQRPWICETEASGLGPPPASGPCVGPTRYDWFYRTTAGTFAPLPGTTSPFPADLAQTTTLDGHTVNYIVRVESGVINESIYRIAVIDDPASPIASPWSPGGTKPGRGWNGKLHYPFSGGASPAYRSGTNGVTSALQDTSLRLGFAVAFGTRNTFGTGANDVVSAETVSMIKERFVEQYGVPRFTIGTGGSGGAIQQHYIAQNYPGLLDALTPGVSYPDLASIAIDVLDCRLVHHYFDNVAGAAHWSSSRRAAVDGYAVATSGERTGKTVCETGWAGFANGWQNPLGESPRGFSDVVPVAMRYHPVTNRTGARGTYWDGNVNAFGIDPATGFARSPYDNVGVQYGLKALNSGAITKAEFLDLNEKIGGLDIDGNLVPHRTAGDPVAIQNAYRSGRIVTSGADLTLPIIDVRRYTDLVNDIHTRIRTFSFLDRLKRANGTIANEVNWLSGGTLAPDLLGMALVGHNEWLEKILADTSADPYAVKVIRNKPGSLKDACWFDAVKHEETFSLDPSARCNQLMPVFSTTRLMAGGTLGGDIFKCQLKPAAASDYAVSFTPEELARLKATFPQGACDWSKPGAHQQPPIGVWLRYGPGAGTFAPMNGVD